jgi:hypothetical protein
MSETNETRASAERLTAIMAARDVAIMLSLVATAIAMSVSGHDELAATALGGALAYAVPASRGVHGKIPIQIIALGVGIGAGALMGTGCGGSALRTHATIATIAAGTLASTAPLVAPACDAALSGCDGAAACIDSTAERCRVAAVAAEGALVATRGYIDAIDVASLADEGLVLPALLSLASALAARWAEVVAALAGVGVALPPLDLGALLGGAS